MGFLRYKCKFKISKLRTISLPLGQKTTRLLAPFSFLVIYRSISTFKRPWLPIQREKRGFYLIYKFTTSVRDGARVLHRRPVDSLVPCTGGTSTIVLWFPARTVRARSFSGSQHGRSVAWKRRTEIAWNWER